MTRPKWLLLALFLIAWGLAAVASYELFVEPSNKGFDFYPRWHGARVMLANNNPYTLEVNLDILDVMRTGTAPPDHNFFYPAVISYILLPFWLIPWPLSISLWMGLTLTLLLILPTITFNTLNWKLPGGKLFLLTLVSAFVFRHATITYVIGQFTVWVLACLILAWVGVTRDNHWLTALALIGSSIRPDGIIITAFFLIELLVSKRHRTVGIWGIIMGLLLGISMLQAGFWIPQFLSVGSTYSTCCVNYYPPSIFGRFSPLFIALIISWFAWFLFETRALGRGQRVLWRLSVTILLVLLIFVQSKDYTLVYGLLPLWTIVWVGKRWQDITWVMLILISPWIFYITNIPSAVAVLVIPFVTAITFTIYWQRFKTSPTDEKSPASLS